MEGDPQSAERAVAESPRRGCWLDLAVLAVAGVAVYANAFDHAFQLDSLHTIRDNPAVRSLANVPAFFTDLDTASTLRSNSDYRPVLMTTYALNHAVAGYAMPVWHATQIALHVACAIGLTFLVRRIGHAALPDPALRWTALATALVFCVHPTAAGVVDYQAARSSLLAAVFSLGAILGFLGPVGRPRSAVARWASVAAFALALFTKVEAIACLGVFWLCEAHERAVASPRPRFGRDVLASLPRALRRMVPHLVVAAGYFAVRQAVMADAPFDESSRLPGVGPREYLLTQTTAWWSYVGHWFWPRGLVADDTVFPVRTELGDPAVLLAIAGWLAVTVLGWRAWRRRPYVLFAAAAALALISPTSSVVPLAEMVNEHRPYLPVAVLSLAWMLPLGELARARGWARRAALGLVPLVVVALGASTWKRGEVFATEATYWRDVLEKAPSARAHTNYARTLMAARDYEGAVRELESSLRFAPNWYITHVNLGVARRELGQHDEARWHFDRAVELDPFNATALFWRGENHLTEGRYREAVADLEKTVELGREPYRSHKGLATAHAGLGEARAALASTRRCLELDRARTELDIVAIVQPFFDAPERYEAGVRYFEGLRETLPEAWWVHENLGNLRLRLGRGEEAAAALAEARRLRGPSDP